VIVVAFPPGDSIWRSRPYDSNAELIGHGNIKRLPLRELGAT
jgi:hypothetical protein